jgi:hypothetical protein
MSGFDYGGRTPSNQTVEWYTPPSFFDALGITFDLDPCAPTGGLPWIPARRFISLPDDGLAHPWIGRVWLNPPYGAAAARWVDRLAEHGDGIALVFARTDTDWWHRNVPSASAVCFVRGRDSFIRGDGASTGAGHNAGAASALIAYGDVCANAVANSRLGMTFSCPASHSHRQLMIGAHLENAA